MNLHFLGDIMLARGVTNNLRSNILKGIIHLRGDGDFIIGNLECSISDRNLEFSNDFQSPNTVKQYLNGITGVSLANNHIFDNGLNTAFDTIKNLDDIGIKHAGIGRNKTEAFEPIYLELQETKFAIFGVTSKSILSDKLVNCYKHIALIEDEDLLQEAVMKARNLSYFVVVLPHLGVEYVDFPSINVVNSYRRIISYGADLVIGNHPHVIQGSEIYKQRYIFYSLGDFVFDKMYSKRKESIIVTISPIESNIVCKISHVIRERFLPVLSQEHFERSKRWSRLNISFTKLYRVKFWIRFVIGKTRYQVFQYSYTLKQDGLHALGRLLISKFQILLKLVK